MTAGGAQAIVDAYNAAKKKHGFFGGVGFIALLVGGVGLLVWLKR
jgi:hypothetical protein